MPEAEAKLTDRLNKKLDGLAAQYADEVAGNVKNIESAEISRTTLTHTGQEVGTTTRTIATHGQDLDRDTKRVINGVREGVGRDYFAYRRRKDADAEPRDVRVEVAGLLMTRDVLVELDETATEWVQDQLTTFAVDIKNTTGAARDAYMKIQEQTTKLERVGIELPVNDVAPPEDVDGNAYPTFERHLFADTDGTYPVKLNDWETTVVTRELDRKTTVAWYRNPGRAARSALRIAYQDEGGNWKSLQVDFLGLQARRRLARCLDRRPARRPSRRREVQAPGPRRRRRDLRRRLPPRRVHRHVQRFAPRSRPERREGACRSPIVRGRQGHRAVRVRRGAGLRLSADVTTTQRSGHASRLRLATRRGVARHR